MSGSRWSRLADARAAALLAARAGRGALAVAPPDGFVAPPGARPVACADPSRPLDVPDGGADVVADLARPEDPGDHAARLRECVRVCRPGGTIVAVAGGGPPGPGALAPRDLARTTACLAEAGAAVVEVVPFDVFGAASPWRQGLGPEAPAVLAELEDLLAHAAVRRAARFLEATVVPALPPSATGRALVVARRGGAPAPSPRRALPLDDPRFGARVLALLQDDAVVRFAAFLDATVLSLPAVAFDLPAWLAAASARPDAGAAARAAADRRGREWYPGLDARRLVEAACVRLARRALAAVAPLDPDGIAPTLEYHLVEAVGRELDRHLEATWTGL